MLASQPTTPPMTSHRMIPIALSFVRVIARSVHPRLPRASIRMQLVVKRLQTAAEDIGGASLVTIEMSQRGQDQAALDLIERGADPRMDSVDRALFSLRTAAQ